EPPGAVVRSVRCEWYGPYVWRWGRAIVKALQSLVRNGNSTQVTIPRAMLMAADLITGQRVMLLLNEDKSITIRLPETEDFLPARSGILRHMDTTGGQR